MKGPVVCRVVQHLMNKDELRYRPKASKTMLKHSIKKGIFHNDQHRASAKQQDVDESTMINSRTLWLECRNCNQFLLFITFFDGSVAGDVR